MIKRGQRAYVCVRVQYKSGERHLNTSIYYQVLITKTTEQNGQWAYPRVTPSSSLSGVHVLL